MIGNVDPSALTPSPENWEIYRPIDETDKDFVKLVDSITEESMRDPLVVTMDDYILSGHRRHRAAQLAGCEKVPIVRHSVRRDDTETSDYIKPVSYTHLTLPTICSV